MTMRWDSIGAIRAWTARVAAMALVAASLVVVTAPPAGAATFTAEADSWVNASQPTRNYGSRTNLRIDATPSRTAYIRFDVQGQAAATTGLLTLTAQTSNSVGFEVRTVVDNSWDESLITFNNAPPVGPVIATSGPVSGGQSYDVDVSAAINGNGPVTFAITTTSGTAARYSSREGANPPILTVPAPIVTPETHFLITRSGATYTATSQTTTTVYSGSLKSVVEQATTDLDGFGGGLVEFDVGTFDLGSEFFRFEDITDIEYRGQGIDVTIITNSTAAATDTEPFNTTNVLRMTVRDLTVSAGGLPRTTSDALDFDGGNQVLVERVKVTSSRGRGIVFDGKDTGRTSTGNVVRDCVIEGTPNDGIEMLAASDNTIDNCTISDVGGHGIQVVKSSSGADQPNKTSDDNRLVDNDIDQAGRDGINVTSGNRNELIDNVITNSADDIASHDGIRITSSSGIACDDNVVDGNLATDNQTPKTQRWGLNIASSVCTATEVGTNTLTGNNVGEINDLGTGTIYTGADTTPPTPPGNLRTTSVSASAVALAWDASTDDVGVVGYDIARDAVPLGSVGSGTLAFVDNGVAGNTSYTYEVTARDAAGNTATSSLGVTTPPASGTVTFTPAADAYVSASAPTTNYGSSGALRVDASPERVAYVRFDVVGVSGVTTATLRIRAVTGSGTGHTVHQVADNSWVESGITYNNAPTVGASLGTSGGFGGGTWLDLDVSGYVTGNGTYTFAVTTPSSTQVRYDSSESSNPPELVVVTP